MSTTNDVGPATAVEVWAVPLALPRPVVTPAGTFATYHHLVVRAVGTDGHAGWGMAAGVTATEVEACAERAIALLAHVGAGADALLRVEAAEDARTATPPDRWSRWAAAALATAGWDLRARRAGVACADLWGRVDGSRRLEAYASGFFLSTTLTELDAEARRAAEAGFRRVKVRTGLDLEADLERLAVVRRTFPAVGSVAVDAVEAWSPADAVAFVEAAGPLLWVEDPVPPGELATFVALLEQRSRDDVLVAAGESLTDLPDLVALRHRDHVGAVLLDVQQVGGPERLLRAARRLGAMGARVGAHVFTPVSTHLLACVEDPLPVEVFDWSDALWLRPPAPGPDGRLPVDGPGLGVDLDLDRLHHQGRLLHRHDPA